MAHAAPLPAQKGASGMQEVPLTPAPSAGPAAATAAAAPGARKRGARSFMVANAALRNWSAGQFAAILLLTIVTQLSWGLCERGWRRGWPGGRRGDRPRRRGVRMPRPVALSRTCCSRTCPPTPCALLGLCVHQTACARATW